MPRLDLHQPRLQLFDLALGLLDVLPELAQVRVDPALVLDLVRHQPLELLHVHLDLGERRLRLALVLFEPPLAPFDVRDLRGEPENSGLRMMTKLKAA